MNTALDIDLQCNKAIAEFKNCLIIVVLILPVQKGIKGAAHL